MAIGTYSELLTAAQNWMARSDADIQARIPEFIALTEGVLSWGFEDPQYPIPRLRVRQMEARDEASVDAEYENISNWVSDFLELRQAKVNSDPVVDLQYLTPQEFDRRYVSSQGGDPKAFTIIGSQFRFGPIPSSAVDVEIQYYQKIPALTALATTNWLLTASPNIYLYGVLYHAAPYVQNAGVGVDADLVSDTLYWHRMFAGAVNGMNTADKMSRYGGMLMSRPGISVV